MSGSIFKETDRARFFYIWRSGEKGRGILHYWHMYWLWKLCGSLSAELYHDRHIPYVIEQEHCLHCGNCMTDCPVGAVERR